MGGLEETEDQRRLGASRGPQTVLLVDVHLQTLDKQSLFLMSLRPVL